MAKKTKTITQLNIDKINRNLLSIAKTFGTNSRPFEDAAQKLFLAGFDTYDKIVNGERVIQMRNNAENRRKHQTIKKIAKNRKTINTLKRKYLPKDYDDPLYDQPAIDGTEPPKEDFTTWYSRIANEILDLVDEFYALEDSCDYLDIPFDRSRAWIDDGYREELWHEIFDKLIDDTELMAGYYEEMGFAVDQSTGENMTETVNVDPSGMDQENTIFDMSWFEDSEFELRGRRKKKR